MTVTLKQLQHILPNAGPQAGVFLPVLNAAMVKWDIVTPLRKRAFLAQVGHESGQLRYVRELGGDQYLSKCDTGLLAARLGNTPGWFWHQAGLNSLADKGPSAFEAITHRINGGLNGLDDRLAIYKRAEQVLI